MLRSATMLVLVLLGLVTAVHGQVAGCAGGGSTAQEPLLKDLRSNVPCMAGLPPYAGGGSKAGQDGINSRAYDYGLSDNPLLPCNLNKVVNVAYAVGLMSIYGRAAPALNNIALTRCAIPPIFTGLAKTWNNGLLTASDARLKTRTGVFKVVIRLDSSGTTWTLTNMMSRACKARWSYTQIYQFSNAQGNPRPLLPFYNAATTIKARGTSALVAAYNAAGVNAVTYAASTRLPALQECRLQINTAAAKFLTHGQTNFQALTAGVALGQLTCNAGTDITALPRDVYPFCYLAWFLAWVKAKRPGQKACVKNMCTCMLSSAGQARINANTEYKALPAAVANTMRTRCNVL